MGSLPSVVFTSVVDVDESAPLLLELWDADLLVFFLTGNLLSWSFPMMSSVTQLGREIQFTENLINRWICHIRLCKKKNHWDFKMKVQMVMSRNMGNWRYAEPYQVILCRAVHVELDETLWTAWMWFFYKNSKKVAYLDVILVGIYQYHTLPFLQSNHIQAVQNINANLSQISLPSKSLKFAQAILKIARFQACASD